MSTWARVTPQSPCATCGKSDWCSVSHDGAFTICRRRDDGTGTLKTDRGGAEYWVYRRDVVATAARPWVSVVKPELAAPSIDPDLLHRIYTTILHTMHLTAPDRRALRQRGLPNDEIEMRRYRSFSRERARDVVAPAVATFGRELCRTVPGVIFDNDGSARLAAAAGLVVPVRDHRGQIVALKVRRRTSDSPRYSYVSSTRANGPGPGSPVHVPLHEERLETTIRLTEGELKADVATVLTRLPTISIAGVGTWRKAIPVLRAMNATTCRLALDGDYLTNPHVARALRAMATCLTREGFALEMETWDRAFKGIDDALVAGGTIEILRGEDALVTSGLADASTDVAI